MAYAVTRRTHEIGVRMALGAQPGDVLRSTLGEGTRLVLIGLALGSAAAVAMSRIVAGFLYGVTAHDPVTYAAVATLLVCIALLAVRSPHAVPRASTRWWLFATSELSRLTPSDTCLLYA